MAVRTTVGSTPAASTNDLHDNGTDMSDDVVGDGVGKMVYSSGDKKYTAEFLIHLVAETNGEDGVFDSNARFDIILYELTVPYAMHRMQFSQ